MPPLDEHNPPCYQAPIYQTIGDDLARAGVLFRAPWLGFALQAEMQQMDGRHPCAWCSRPDAEWGHHLLRCDSAPAAKRALRDQALAAVLKDATPPDEDPSTSDPTSEANLDRLYALDWTGHTDPDKSRRKYRADAGRQSAVLPLRKALWYMRECINAYSARSPTYQSRGKAHRRVPPLPVYGRDPFSIHLPQDRRHDASHRTLADPNP